VVKRFDDEIGTLIDSFNEMLIQIQDRNAELTQSRDELEDRVNARTRQLQEEVEERKRTQMVVNNLLMKISEDNEKLVRLDEMKSEFLSIVSHELRTPLTAITGYLKLLNGGSAGPLNETQKDFLQTVLRNSDRLFNLVNDLLDLSRLESGNVKLNLTTFDLGMILDQSVKGLRSLADQKKITLQVKRPDTPVSFEVDVQRLEQILVNLVGNSLKFTPNNGTIELGGRKETRAGTEGVLMWVKDTGVGIPLDALTKIFDKFYQVENSSTRKTGGTGLGLAITSKLVAAHNGAIWVESEQGKGSTFWIFLPLQQDRQSEV
jgi:signal transduction histidine kinase